MITRREFIQTVGVIGATGLLAHKTAYPFMPKTTKGDGHTLRTITYNVRGCKGSQDVDADPDLVRLARPQIPFRIGMELALYEPDIVTMQEAPEEATIAQIAKLLDMDYLFFQGGNPGALMTRLPIIEYKNCPLVNYDTRPDELFTRHWGRALLDTPLGGIAVYSAHLWPYQKGNNGKEVAEVIEVMQTDIKNNRSLILQGDLNHTPGSPDYGRWQNAGLVDTFIADGSGTPFTSPNGLKHPALKERIDYIWACGPIASMVVQCRALYERTFRSYHDDPRSFSLSDHIPVMATFIENNY